VFTSLDHTYMAQALRLAEEGLYTSQPNPHVGCVIVKDGQIIGQGAHLKAGEAHAEVNALNNAGVDVSGADVYVTLEPCSHHGRTAPCAEALVKANVKRVVIAMQDPNPLVAGQGIQYLKDNSILVEVGLMEAEAAALNVGFIKRMTHKLPYVRCKLAVSLDGKTALGNGKSHWITGESARLDVQRWRARSCAVITGIGTVLSDNPSMTVRLYDGARQPLRVLVDSQLSVPLDSKMLTEHDLIEYPICIAYAVDRSGNAQSLIDKGVTLLHLPQVSSANTRVDLLALLQTLAMRGCNEVLIEAGHGLNGGFMQAHLIDECIIYYAPKIMGGDAMPMFAIKPLTQMAQAIEFTLTDIRQIGTDIRVIANPLIQSS
jgi:diaminohydroxyphosphoribosylaminopyrimidine deaminase/5-amino-6-(5-phosphoribosylamino)uracil reductase